MPVAVTFMWTALPRRVRNNKLELTAYLSMRLTPEVEFAYLSDFPLFATWPAPLAAAQFRVQFTGGPNQVDVVLQPQLVGDPALFVQIFPPTTLVRPFTVQSELLDVGCRTFDARGMDGLIRDIYGEVASDPSFGGAPPQLRDTCGVRKVIETIGPLAEGVYLGDTPEARLAMDFHHFYERHGQGPGVLPPVRKELDVHERLSLLGDYPELLRKFGICVDLEIDLAMVPALAPNGHVSVQASWAAGVLAPEPTTLVNHTAYHFDVVNGLFRAAERPGDSDLRDGMLRLSGAGWSVLQGELDGAAWKLLDLSTNAYARARRPCAKADERLTLPALYSTGFTVVRTGRCHALWEQVNRSMQFEQQPADTRFVLLYADDLTRGYRIDVQRNDDTWRPLCRRVGQVTLGGVHQVPIDDEGYVKLASAALPLNADGYPIAAMVHEAVFSWDGWSLVAPRPGRTILDPTDNTTVRDPNNPQVGDVSNVAPPDVDYSMATDLHAAPRTLPRLRFGDRYSLRARAVDLAGNSLELAEVLVDHAPEQQTYLRFEPVATPVLVPRERFVEGESLEHLVVRSIVDDAELLAAFSEVPKSTTDRHIAPAKVTQNMAETHGLLDALMINDPAAAYALSLREQGTFLDQALFGDDIEIVGPPGVSTDFPAARGEPLAPGAYVIHTATEVEVPYLADPFSRGVAVQGLLGKVSRDFNGTWPDIETVRLRLTGTNETQARIEAGAGAAPIEVALPPATIARLTISSTLREADLEQTWVWSLIRARARPDDLANVRALATSGGHWMLTPRRELELVHAVQRPLRDPNVTSANPTRDRNATWVEYSPVKIDLDAHSTGTIDVTAEWSDEVDTGGEHEVLTYTAHAFQLTVAYDDADGVFSSGPPSANSCEPLPSPMRQEIGDTRHHVVKLRATGTTRFREYFPRELWVDEQNLTRSGELSQEFHIPSSAAPEPPRIAYMLPTFEWRDVGEHERQRIGGGLRIYLQRPWFSSGEGELLAVLLAAPESNVDASKYVSHWGHDPLWIPAGPSTLTGQMTPAQLFREEAPTLRLQEDPGLQVRAVSFPVGFNAERGLWYCDIELDPGTAYFPFVRLALARYQPYSLAGLELSRVVRADFAQLTPNRSATTTRDGDNVTVTVTGPSAMNNLDQGGHLVHAVVQSRAKQASDLLWQDEPEGPVTLPLLGLGADGVATWQGVVVLPWLDPAREYRLLVTEREIFNGEGGPRQRIVYADAFSI